MNSRHQTGQAVTEFSVALLVFIPLVLLLVVIAHMLNIQTTAHKASRYLAWERTAYTEADYNSKMSGGVDNFNDEITSRFITNAGAGFSDGSAGFSRAWRNPENGESLVNLEQGASVGVDELTAAQQTAQNYLSTNMGYLSSEDDNGGMSVDTISPAKLSIPLSIANSELLNMASESGLQVSSSFALVADGWAPASEAEFSDAVSGMRDGALTQAHRFMAGGVTAFFAPVFQEISTQLYNGDAPFEMVSPNQSTALPSNLPMYTEE